jgi:hypothetical protein
MPVHISSRFESNTLPVSGFTRVITRNRDDGGVPPNPSSTYYPTNPDAYREFIVAEWAGDLVGESFVRAASFSLNDFGLLTYSPMNQFEDMSGNFASAQVNDILEILLPDTTLWTSEEYPASNFIFTVTGLVDANNVLVSPEIPAFRTGLTWELRRVTPPSLTEVVITQGILGIPRRPGVTVPLTKFREKRFNSYFTSAVDAVNFVSATKIEMQLLTDELLNAEITIEDFTAGPA